MAPAEVRADGGVVLLLRAAADSLRVVSAGDAGRGLDLSLRKARDALACTNAVFCAVDGSGSLIVRASADPEGLQVGDSMDHVTTLSGQVLRSGEAARSTANGVRKVSAASNGGRRPMMAVPVVSGGTIAGVLSVCRDTGEPEYTDDELSALSTFGDFMGVVTDVERERAERESMVEIAVRERLGQAVLNSVISELLRATTGMHGVLAAVDGQQREELIRYVRAVDRALVGFRGILAGEFAEPAPEAEEVREARSGRPKAESTVRFPGSFAPGGDWGWEDVELLDEMDDYIAAILGDLYKVTTQLALGTASATPAERRLLSQSVRQLDVLTGRVRGAAVRIRASTSDQAQLSRLHVDLAQTNPLRSDQIAMVGRDVRAPLGIVLGCLEALEEQHLSEEQTDVLARASRAARRTHDLVERMLALAVADSSRVVTHPEPVDLDRWLPEFLETVDDGAEVTVLGEPSHGAILFDRSQLAQILTNLLSNAFRHGARPVTLTVHDHESSTQIEVTDAGAGVPTGGLDELFERTAPTNGTAADGALHPGLGLHLSRRLAEANGADLTFHPGGEGQPGRFVLEIQH